MASTRDIRTNQVDIACDVCGRTLLRGERAEPYLTGGQRRQVCELCTVRAQNEGWIREQGGDELTLRTTRQDGRGRSFLDRLRGRRARAREVADEAAAVEAAEGREPIREPAREAPAVRPTLADLPRRPRHVRAVPTNADLKVQRALEVFNGSDHTRTVGGISRSLGAPVVCVRSMSERPSVVGITVMWELSWYRYEIDLSDEAGGVRRAAQGDELSELEADEQVSNAAADERGALHISTDGR
ncbi:MAG TPA: hypothetical protein VES79_01375 [Solirubrobacteraceae bacterium]|nr:hypothetical protein [Solirubrobacteraceae bacterium]